MALETATYISDLNTSNPDGSTDTVSTLDDHVKLIKSTLKTTFPNVTGAVTPTHTVLNYMLGVTSAVQTQLDAKAALVSPALSGAPTAPTAAAGTNTTQIATMAALNRDIAAAAMSSTTPTVAGDVGKLWASTGTIGNWSSSLKASVIRFADGTDATKLLAFDLSSITTATTRTVALPDKNGTLAMTSDLSFVLLATLTPTAAANVDALSTFTSSYDNYLIIGEGIKPATNDNLQVRFAVAGTADSGANYYYSATSGASVTVAGTSASIIPNLTSAGVGACFQLIISNCNDATNIKSAHSFATGQIAATPGYSVGAGGYTAYAAANAVSGVRFFWNGGANFAATGKIRIYGYNNT